MKSLPTFLTIKENILYFEWHKRMNRRVRLSSNAVVRALYPACITLLVSVLALSMLACSQPESKDPVIDQKDRSLQQFGAKCDGKSDDSRALLAYAEYCAENGTVMTVPVDANVLVSSFVSVPRVKNIQVLGTITAPNGIEFRANSKQTLNHWDFNRVKGSLRLAGLKSSNITVEYADELTLYADSNEPEISSIAYNKFWLGHVRSLTFQGIGKGWINENFFYGGRIRNLLFADGGSYPHNNNHFYDSTFESATIDFYCGRSNYIHDARFEGDVSVSFHKRASNNYVHRAWVGECVPGVLTLPSWWHDESNNNYYYYSIVPPLNTYEKALTVNSYNYNADLLYPENGKLHNQRNAKGLIETELIPIDHAVGITIESDVKFFRGRILLYDADGRQIEQEPEHSPIYGGSSIRWNGDSYVFGDVNRRRVSVSLSRNTIIGGDDTGVAFAKIIVNGYGTAEFEYLRISVTAPWYVCLEPFGKDDLVASSPPKKGDWKDNILCFNTGSGEPNAWIYRNTQWVEAF